jgi:hypothetical protein
LFDRLIQPNSQTRTTASPNSYVRGLDEYTAAIRVGLEVEAAVAT